MLQFNDQAHMEQHSSRHPTILQVLVLIFPLILHSQPVSPLATDNHRLIFNHCPNQTSSNPSHSKLLPKLFQEFIARSSKSSFSKTIVADDDYESAVSGVFQCRTDLSPDECRSCVSKFQGLSQDLCAQTLPARIQLSGCYVHYKADQDDNNDDADSQADELVHKACSKRMLQKHGYEEIKYEALAALENGVMIGNGFCEMNYKVVHVVAQCTRGLGMCDCGGCVSNAVQIAVDDCQYSVSGEVYLDSCFISFDYNEDHGFGGYSFDDGSSKLVAIVVGGLAAALLGLALCYFLRSCGKKKDGIY